MWRVFRRRLKAVIVHGEGLGGGLVKPATVRGRRWLSTSGPGGGPGGCRDLRPAARGRFRSGVEPAAFGLPAGEGGGTRLVVAGREPSRLDGVSDAVVRG